MRNQLFSLFIIVGMLCTQAAYAQGVKSELSEATEFLNQVMHDTKNPLIASLMQENLSKLNTGDLPAEQTLSQKMGTDSQEVEVPLLGQVQNSLAVPVTLEGHYLTTFIVDTGATYTVISPAIAQKIGVEITPQTPRIAILTANGVINAPIVTLKHVCLGNLEISNVQVIVQNLGNDPHFSGLLGMNFFKNLEFGFRKDKMVIRISSAK